MLKNLIQVHWHAATFSVHDSYTVCIDTLLLYTAHSLSRIVTVCSGDQLELICTITGRLLEWSFYLIPENSTMFKRYGRVVQNGGLTEFQTSNITVNSNMIFKVSRISDEDILPLRSELSLNPVTTLLNGTKVNCTDVTTSNATSMVIHVISEDSVIHGMLVGEGILGLCPRANCVYSSFRVHLISVISRV